MNYRQRFLEIRDFLQPYQSIWQNEIMLQYPSPFVGYPMDWIEELAQFKEMAEIIPLEKKSVHGLLKNQSLLEFYQKIEGLTQVSQAIPLPPVPTDRFTFLFMTPKKQYEIRLLAPHVNNLYQNLNLEQVIDIGGGIGLMAQTLANQYGLNVATLDLDPVMQKTGNDRQEKSARNPHNRLNYHHVKVDAQEEVFLNLLGPNKLTLGLHTCGSLAVDQLRASTLKKVRGIINLGCCYHKLPCGNDFKTLSQFVSQHSDFKISKFALTLAARAHRKMDEKDFDLKMKVKLYRYAIHFLLHDEYGIKKMVTLGNSTPKLYDETFGTYALEQFKRIDLIPTHSKEELDAYFNLPERQDLIWKMMAGGYIRNAMGRVLEFYLQLDRVLYLEEQGYRPQLFELFDGELSPRNLAIIATRIQ